MASNVITVNPRKKRDGSAPSSRRVVSDLQDKPGTILLRNPLPKYSFEKKYTTKNKQPKENSSNKDSKDSATNVTDVSKDANVTDHSETQRTVKPHGANVSSSSRTNNSVSGDTTGIGRLVNSFPQAMMMPEVSQIETQSAKNSAKTEAVEVSKLEKPVNKVDPFSLSESKSLTHSVSAPAIDLQSQLSGSQSHQCSNSQSSNSYQTGLQRTQIEGSIENNVETSPASSAEGASELDAASVATALELAGYRNKIKTLEDEKQQLRNHLDVQLQVNQEIKKLLVASVGEDVHRRVERLMTERAQMSLELGDFSKKMTEDCEHLDKIAIQADMWRSKYLACRVMSDELAASRAFYSMQYQECQVALQQLLSERHELKANLYESYRGLQQIQEAFDPLNTQNASQRTLNSKHIIDLARTNQTLVDRIKYRLLPGHVTSSLSNKMEPDWHDYLTQAEAHAQQLLSREMRPEDFRCLSRPAIMAPSCMAVDRYHPFANFDNLTLNVCCQCKGDIHIV